MPTFNPPSLRPMGTFAQFTYPRPQLISTQGVPYQPRVPGIAYYPRQPGQGYVFTNIPSVSHTGIRPGQGGVVATGRGGVATGLVAPGLVGSAMGIASNVLSIFTGRRPGMQTRPGGRHPGGFRPSNFPGLLPGLYPSMTAPGGVTAPGATNGGGAPADGGGASAGGGGGSGDMPAGAGGGAGAGAAEASMWEAMPLWQKALAAVAAAGAVYYGYRWYTGRKSASVAITPGVRANPRRKKKAKRSLKSLGVVSRGRKGKQRHEWGGLVDYPGVRKVKGGYEWGGLKENRKRSR